MNINKNDNSTSKWNKTHYLGIAAGVALAAVSVAGIGGLKSSDGPIADQRATAASAIKLSPVDNRVNNYVVLGSQEEADRLREQIMLDSAYWESTARYYFYAITNEAEQEDFYALFADMDGPYRIQDLRFPALPGIKDGVPVEHTAEAVEGTVAVADQLRKLAGQPQFGTAADAEFAVRSLVAEGSATAALEPAMVSSDRVLSSAERITAIAKRPDLPATLYLHVALSQQQADHLRSVLSTEAAHFSAYMNVGTEVLLIDSPEAIAALNLTVNELNGHGITVLVVEPPTQ